MNEERTGMFSSSLDSSNSLSSTTFHRTHLPFPFAWPSRTHSWKVEQKISLSKMQSMKFINPQELCKVWGSWISGKWLCKISVSTVGTTIMSTFVVLIGVDNRQISPHSWIFYIKGPNYKPKWENTINCFQNSYIGSIC